MKWVASGSLRKACENILWYLQVAESFTWHKLLNSNNTRGSSCSKGINQRHIHNESYNKPENLNVRLLVVGHRDSAPMTACGYGNYCVISSAFFPARLPGTKQQQ